MGRNKKYDEEFKKQAVDMVLNDRLSVTEVGRQLGVGKSAVHASVAAARDVGRKPSGETLEEELKRLRKEVKSLQEDKLILKKAAAFFVRESK